jgi:hypothetical protein
MKNNTRLLTILVVLTLTALACGQFRIGIEAQSNGEVNVINDQVNNETENDNQDTNNASKPGNEAPKPSPTPPLASQYWKTVVDPRTGVRFAIPCYWEANIPTQEQDPTGLGGFAVANFTEDFIFSLGPKRGGTVWEIGGMKFDIGYHKRSEMGLSENAPLEEMAYTLVNPDQEHGITSTKTIQVNGKQVLQVETWSTFGDDGRFYLLPTGGELVILYAPYPADHTDFQGILYSFATSPEDPVIMPTHQPADPPTGMAAECLGILEPDTSSSNDGTSTISSYPIDCINVTEQDALMWTVCNVLDSFVSRNTQPLLGYMADPFILAYWRSEGVTNSRDQAFTEIVNNYIPGGTSTITFTADPNLFPSLYGPPEDLFGPENAPAKIIYGEGLGLDGNSAAFLYFKQAEDGQHVFYAMLIGPQDWPK